MLAVGINRERLWESLMNMAQVGALPDGGVSRLALTDADRQARDLLGTWLRMLGLEVQVDQVGNMVAIRPGELKLPAVLLGSHLDTVDSAGRFDGAAGVLAGLEVIRTLHENNVRTRHPIGLVMFTNEEGARYHTDLMGSRAFTGALSSAEIWSIRGIDGSLVGDELRRIGYLGEMECGILHPQVYLELHVEQGPQLDARGIPLGIVEAITGITWIEVTVQGIANHAGTTPMEKRRDAGLAAAGILALLPRLVERIPGLRATCGCFSLYPGTINVIPGEARLTVDLRHVDPLQLEEAERSYKADMFDLARRSDVTVAARTLGHIDPQVCNSRVVDLLADTCTELDYRFQRMVSGAGHDAQAMAKICPAAMIFVPSREGISHSPAEYSSPEDLERGANLLLHAALRLAYQDK